MVSFITTVTTALALACATTAAPTDQQVDAQQVDTQEVNAQEIGSITWFYPGLGACGGRNGNNDLIVAVSARRYDTQKLCGRKIRVTRNGKSVDVKVVDRCEGCAYNDLDLSPAAFTRIFNNLGVGRGNADWKFI